MKSLPERLEMKKGWKIVLVIVCAAILLFVTRSAWLPLPGLFLTVTTDRIQKADCVVPLRGEDYYRIKKASELVKEGWTDKIIISPVWREISRLYFNNFNLVYDVKVPPEKEVLLRYFAHFGKNEDGIELTNHEVTSTFEEALATREALLKKGYRSMILVTSGYHMRRALIIFSLVMQNTGIRIDHATGESPLFHPETWWHYERDVKEIAEEYVSVIFNLIYHFVLKKNRTSFDAP